MNKQKQPLKKVFSRSRYSEAVTGDVLLKKSVLKTIATPVPKVVYNLGVSGQFRAKIIQKSIHGKINKVQKYC